MHSCANDAGMFLSMLGYPDNNGSFPLNFERPASANFAGLAFLCEDLSIVSDATFEFSGIGRRRVEDLRLFVLHDQIYWSSFGALSAMWLVEPEDPRTWVTRLEPRNGSSFHSHHHHGFTSTIDDPRKQKIADCEKIMILAREIV